MTLNRCGQLWGGLVVSLVVLFSWGGMPVEASYPTHSLFEVAPIKLPTGSDPRLYDFSLLYQKGLARELLGTYEDALVAYEALLPQLKVLLREDSSPVSLLKDILPFAIASAYRRGLATHRLIEGGVVKLHTQLKQYEETDKWINEILTTISNLNLEGRLHVSPTTFGLLYFARAYNRMGWAYAVWSGSTWKRYVIYTPANVMEMVKDSMRDLELAMAVYGYTYEQGGNDADLEREIDHFFHNGMTQTEKQVFQLCYNVEAPEFARQVARKQFVHGMKLVVDRFYSEPVQAAMAVGQQTYTFEDFLKPETGQVTKEIASLLGGMASQGD